MDNKINSSLAFQANFDSKFLKASNAFLRNRSNREISQFDSAVRRFEELPNSDHLTISYKKKFVEGKPMHMLFAGENNENQVVLAAKDQFRKLIQKFSYMNEYEFQVKTGIISKN